MLETAAVSGTRIAFGPVPSRRLGRSLGINNIPPKHCSYSCVYCQVGHTSRRETTRRAFLPPERIVSQVVDKVARCRAVGQRIDYLTFVPDGEPTLDCHLGRELRELGPIGIPRAVISNGSLLGQKRLRLELAAAELVSLKVDAGDEETWRRVDRPAAGLDFADVRAGAIEFAAEYRGELVTETMLVAGLNDSVPALEATADLLAELAPVRSYLAVPTRPPAEPWVRAPGAAELARAHALLREKLSAVEWLTESESGDFDCTGDAIDALLAILAVHPMPARDAADYLSRAGAPAGALAGLIEAGRVERLEYAGEVFVARPELRWSLPPNPRRRGGET